MSRRAMPVLALLLLAVGRVTAAEPATFFFRPGDRVVFLGDSITEQYQYSSYIELYLTTRFPTADMTFINAGIGGDTATGGAGRFARHVLSEKPSCVTIDFGMNDGGYKEYDPAKAEQFIKSTERMLEAAKKAGVRVALISPNAVEVRNRSALAVYLETQAKFYAPLKDLAAKYDVPFVDQYAVTRKVLEKLTADNAAVKPFPDSVHTGPAGGLLMAHTILTGLHAPARVSKAVVDVKAGKADGRGCTVTGLEAAADRAAFVRTDEALPMPALKAWRDLLPYMGHLADLNNYNLTVAGLAPGKYDLRIDGAAVATYSAEELAAGVNVGNADKGPVYEQGMKVFAAITAKNNVVHKRFRQVVMFDPRTLPEWVAGPVEGVARKRDEELAKRAEQISAKQAEVYRLVKPLPHQWEIMAAK